MPGSKNSTQIKAEIKPLWESGKFRLIILFGSVAKGSARDGSDLDLAFLPKASMDELEITNQVISKTHWNEVDVVNLKHAAPLLMMEIAKNGEVLYSESPSDFAEFASLAFRRYVDTEKLRKAQRRALDLFEKKQ